jgi:glycosyl hydrolase family 2
VTRYPHRIRLRGPWECEPLERRPPGDLPPPRRMTLPCRWPDGGLADFTGRVRFRRRFGYPGRIDDYERVWLTFEGASDRAAVRLNGADLGEHAGDGPFEFDVTALLRARNELVVDVDSDADRGGLWGEVALEVRCKAFLREVRVWAEGGELHAAGLVVGEAERPLDLYLLLDGATAAYTAVAAAPVGAPFHIIAEKPPPRGEAQAGKAGRLPVAQVDLVNGAVVWYSAAQELAVDGRQAAPGG